MTPLAMLWPRDTLSDIQTAPLTFSSWDNCMAKAYCKWPVIVGIVIGSLILLSIIFCIARCLCCGLECCCACCSCFNACCPSPRRRGDLKYADPPPKYHAAPYQGYQAPVAAPFYGPQTATFDANGGRKGGNVNEDSLPAMPGWDSAQTRKVFDTSHQNEDVELGRIDTQHDQSANLLQHQQPAPQGSPYVGDHTTPYQDHAALNGADLGSPYAGQHQQAGTGKVGAGASYYNSMSPTSIRPTQGFSRGPSYTSGTTEGYRGTGVSPLQGGGSWQNGNTAYSRPQYAPQQGGYEGYAPSEVSTRYEPTSTYGGQEAGVRYPGPGASRKPVPASYRDV